MARFLFLIWDGGGSVPPMLGLAQELRARGHAVAFAGQELGEDRVPLRDRVAADGFAFTALERSAAMWAATPPGPRIVAAMMACPAHLRDLPDAIARWPCDVLVLDCLMFGALAAAEGMGLPAAVLVHSAPGALAAPGGPMEGSLLAAVNGVRAAAGQRPVASLWEAWARFPTLCATMPTLDRSAAQAPDAFDYVGPIFARVPASGWRPPWPADDPRPLVLVSFTSTTAWEQRSRIGRTLAALAGRPYRVLVTTSMADVAGLRVPENAVLVQHVPHGEVLPQAAVAVNHAGHGSVIAALAHGVPLVCLPNPVGDQPLLAARVAELGAGLALDGEAATAPEIGDAVARVVAERGYAEAARQLAGEIAATAGAATAATRLEGIVGVPRLSR